MTGEPTNLRGPDGEALDVEPIVRALERKFAVTPGPSRVVQRTRLDTFDRRLRSAGMSLEHDAVRGEGLLLLERTSGPSSTVPVAGGIRWPAFADALPAGSVREQVAPVSDIRALTVVAEEKRRVRRLELRNRDGKTVVRIDLDEPAGGGASRPATVTVRELRGYGDQARRAVTVLTGLGLRPASDVEADSGDAEPAGVDRDAPAGELLSSAFAAFLRAMNDNLPGLLADIDTEFLHDFRVAVRRTRATLKLGRPALPDEMRSRWEPEFKWLGDLTTPVRDLDVYELDLPTMGGWLVAADASDLAQLASHLRRRRSAQRRILLRGLRSARFERLRSEWAEALADLAGSPPHDGAEALSAGELAGRGISRAARRVIRNGTAVSASSPAEDLHDLRKRCKELRYALEVFAPVIGEADRKRAVADLKGLQDVLGRFQDTEVQRHALRGFAEEMMADGTPTQAVLAMGELIGHLDAEQDRAREEFDASFARFSRPASIARLDRLGGSR